MKEVMERGVERGQGVGVERRGCALWEDSSVWR